MPISGKEVLQVINKVIDFENKAYEAKEELNKILGELQVREHVELITESEKEFIIHFDYIGIYDEVKTWINIPKEMLKSDDFIFAYKVWRENQEARIKRKSLAKVKQDKLKQIKVVEDSLARMKIELKELK